MLTIDHLEKQFGSTVLFRGLTFTVDGPAVLWAPSGWGKTTLLRILMGLETPTAGRVQGAGRVSAVFQEDRLCPQLTAVQNVLLVLPDGRQEAAIRQDFARLGLDEAALALPARKLSGGQKRRTALLRALWAQSDTLLLDEPFTGMDPAALQASIALPVLDAVYWAEEFVSLKGKRVYLRRDLANYAEAWVYGTNDELIWQDGNYSY